MELFLARVIGLYLLIVGIVVVVRRKSIMPGVADMAANRGILIALGAIELAAGLSLVVAYPYILAVPSIEGIFSVIGYMLIIESIIYFSFPARSIRRIIGKFNRPEWYIAGGLISTAAGAYMAATAFGLM